MSEPTSKMGRRMFLGGAASVAALAGLGHRQVAASAAQPRRFVFFLSGNGMDAQIMMSDAVKSWIATSRGGPVRDDLWWGDGYGANQGYGESHASLETLVGLSSATGLGMLGDLESQACLVLGLSQAGVTGGHSAFHGVLSATRTIGSAPGGVTLDEYLSNLECVRGAGDTLTPLPVLRVGVTPSRDAVSFDSCASAAGRSLPMLLSPSAVWDAFVRPIADPMGRASLERRTRLLEFALTDAMRASRDNPPGLARRQADAYVASVDSLLRNQNRFGEVFERSGDLVLPPRPLDGLGPLQAMRAQMANVSVALRTGMTNVAVIGMGTGGHFHGFRYGVGPRTAEERHGLCHAYGGSDTAAIRAELRMVWQQEIESVVSLARELRDTPEPDGSGSMLDRTVLVYTPDNGVGHHARSNDHPVLLLGGQALGLHTGGRTLLYPGFSSESPQRRQLSNLWNTLGGIVAGATLDDFGDRRGRFADGPLAELLA